MKKTAFLFGFFVSLSFAGTAHSSDTFPNVDSNAYCEMIMGSNPAAASIPGLTESCVETDRESEAEARSRWRATTPEIRTDCRDLSKLNGHYSYGLVLGCIRNGEQRI